MIIHFIRPLILFTYVPIMLYWLWTIYISPQKNPWQKICDPHLLPHLIQNPNPPSFRIINILLFVWLSIAIFALAGPAWKKTSLPVYRDVSSIVVILDLSSAMELTDLKPNRLTRAKLKIRDLIRFNKNMQMGLVALTSEAFIASPLSQDATTLYGFLEELSPHMMPISGIDTSEGLKLGLTLLKQAQVHSGSLLLITASEPTANSWAIAKTIQEAGHQLNVFAMIDMEKTSHDLQLHLQQLAELGGGHLYPFTTDDKDIKSISTHHFSSQLIQDDHVKNTILWQDIGPWFCLLLVPLNLFILRVKTR